MDRYQVLEFWVKPSGILASKRYVRVFADDNGNITREDVPGKPSINLNSVDDYKSTSFTYSNGQELTRFCNTTTFTRYRILASRTSPFATVQTDLDEPACGYLEPLPTPAVPTNPFGTAPYDLFAFYDFCDTEGESYRVNINRKNYNNQSVIVPFEILTGGADPVRLRYTGGDDKFTTIRPCVCDFTFIATENFPLSSLYSFDEREFLLEVISLSTNDIKFKGFITPSDVQEPFNAPPYEVTVRASDGLGALKTITYPVPVGSSTDIRQKFTHILAFALAKTNLNLDIMTICNIYATGMQSGLDNDPLEQASVSPLRMTSSDGGIYSCYEALDAVCTQFGASLSQVNGKWVFGRVNEFAKGSARYRLYDYTARLIIGGTLSTLKLAGAIGQSVVLTEHDHVLSTSDAYKMVKVLQEYGRAPDVIYNGGFEDWDGQNFRYWTRYGAINVQRVQKTITASQGVTIPIEDYACRFMQRADSGKWLEGSPIWVNEGQTAKLSLNIGKTDGLYDFKVRFKVGQFYLTNDNGTFEWINELSTTTIRVDNSLGDIFSFAINVEIPKIPVSGDMIIQFYGFTKIVASNSGSAPSGGGRPVRGAENGVGGSTITYYEVDEYTPIDIDNVGITSQVSDDKKTKGIINVSSQNGLYTNKPDEITVIWGEYKQGAFDPTIVTGSFTPARPRRRGEIGFNPAPQAQLQTIYLPDNSDAKGWFEYGETSSPSPIGLCLARAILKAYQTNYNRFSGTMQGDDLSYLDTFNIIVPNSPQFSSKIFVWQDADFSLKYKKVSGNLVEIFSKTLISNDYTTPQLPGSTGEANLPPIIQNPNTPSNLIGIFTEEFTPEFN